MVIRLAPILAKSHDKQHRLRIRQRSNVSAAPCYLTEDAISLPNNCCTSYFLIFMRRSGYQPASLIFRISHQENSPAPNPDADLFPEKGPRLFEPPSTCFGHSTVGLHVDYYAPGTRRVVSASMASLMMRPLENLKMRSRASLY